MKLIRDKIVNLTLILFLGIVLFTPLGFQIKVFLNRIVSFNPTELKIEEQTKLLNYNWHIVTQEGTSVNFDNFKGKVIVINFWATWCPPCVAEMPDFQELYNDYNGKVSFLFIAHDEKEKVHKFLIDKGFDLPVYYQNSETPKKFFSKSIPQTFIIGKKGEIVVSETGAADWNSKVTRKLLDKLLLE